MTGADLARIEQLPDTAGMERRGRDPDRPHGPLRRAGRAGYPPRRRQGACRSARATYARPYQLEGAIGPRTAAAVYVVSHHAVGYGQIPLPEFCRICRAHGVPVIVDAASEYDLKGFLAAGADLVIYSAHKFLGGPTAGIVAGRKDLVRAAYLQNCGIGRGMKVGKESIAGAMAALEAWAQRDHAAVRALERDHLELWLDCLGRLPGLDVAIVPDPTDNPLDRLEVQVDPGRGRDHGLGAGGSAGRRRPAGDRPRPRGRARPFLPRPLQPPPRRGRAGRRADRRDAGGHPRPTFTVARGAPRTARRQPPGMAGLSWELTLSSRCSTMAVAVAFVITRSANWTANWRSG